MRRAVLALLALLLQGCFAAQIHLSAEEMARVERAVAGEDRFLRVSFHSTPFFGDSTKRLLTPVAPSLVRLLEQPGGGAIEPGPVEATWPVGTPVRITKIEFPSNFAMAERVLKTPRTLAWVYVDVGGTPRDAAPSVVVMRPGLKTEAELYGELDRLLSRQDPRGLLDAFSEPVREAIKAKKALVDMPASALEMAWGYPDMKKIELDGTKRRETWTWAEGQQVARLVDGRVTELR